MGKNLVIKGADFSENAVGQELNPTVFNTQANGKFKVNYPALQCLNLSSNAAAAPWCVEYINVESLVGRTLRIGYVGITDSATYPIICLDYLIPEIRDKDYTFTSYAIDTSHLKGASKCEEEKDILYTIPNGASILYVSYITVEPPLIELL